MKKIAILLLLLTSIMLIISCKQPVDGNEQVIETNEPEIESEEKIDMEHKMGNNDFDLAKTIEVLQQALPNTTELTERSNVIDSLKRAGIRGATQARLIYESGYTGKLEVVCEDNRTYELILISHDVSDRRYYSVEVIEDMQTGECVYSVYDVPKSPSTWAEKGQRDPVEFDVKATQEVLRSVLVDNNEPDGYNREEFWAILDDMRMLGIPGATHAALHVDPDNAKRRIIEIVSEDGKNYRFDLTRIESDRGVRYIVYSVTDLDTGEILWHELDDITVW